MSLLKSLLSYVAPVPMWKGEGRYGTIRLVYESGHLVVNSRHANQSWGSLHDVWQQCFADEGIQERKPKTVLILGFGAGSIASILRREMRSVAPITGVDGDDAMLAIARDRFKMDQLPDLRLVHMDALEFVAAEPGRYGLVLVDLFHELDLAPGIDEEEFIRQLARITDVGGMVCFNTVVHNNLSLVRSQRTGQYLRLHFNEVREHRYNGINLVFSAWQANATPSMVRPEV
ncbi:MAG: spermidine synthase [Flavobacteriales bacterium]